MRTKIVIIAENDMPSYPLKNKFDENEIKKIIEDSWNILLEGLCKNSSNMDRAHVEYCELLED